MWLELVRSRAVVNTVLLVMLLGWLGGSFILTLRAGHGAAPRPNTERRRQQHHASNTPRSSHTTMPPRAPAADSLRS